MRGRVVVATSDRHQAEGIQGIKKILIQKDIVF